MKEVSSITTREHFKRSSSIKFSQQEKIKFKTPSQSSSIGEKRGIKPTIVISDDDEFIKSSGRSNLMDKAKSSKKRNEISKEQGTNKPKLFKRSRRSIGQKDSGIPLSKRNNNVKKPGVNEKKSKSYNEREKLSRIIHSSDDEFLDIPIRKLKKRNNFRVRPNDHTPRYHLRPRKFHATKIIDDGSETLSKQSEEFRVPSPARNKYANLPEMDLLSEEEIPIKNNSRRKREGSAEHDQCPFCDEPIPFPIPERIRTYLIKINSSARGKLSDPPLSVLRQHSLNVVDQFEFCRLHYAETHTVPEGLKKNYPIKIDFNRLPERVENLISELTLVIKGKKKSLYRDIALNAYQELGRARARNPTFLMGRFQKFQPGYYGTKGASIILSSLVSLFMDTNILTMDMTKPQEPLEYLSQVLVPETAIRLISHDQCITLEEAMKVMEDSVEFGTYVHDVDEI